MDLVFLTHSIESPSCNMLSNQWTTECMLPIYVQCLHESTCTWNEDVVDRGCEGLHIIWSGDYEGGRERDGGRTPSISLTQLSTLTE